MSNQEVVVVPLQIKDPIVVDFAAETLRKDLSLFPGAVQEHPELVIPVALNLLSLIDRIHLKSGWLQVLDPMDDYRQLPSSLSMYPKGPEYSDLTLADFGANEIPLTVTLQHGRRELGNAVIDARLVGLHSHRFCDMLPVELAQVSSEELAQRTLSMALRVLETFQRYLGPEGPEALQLAEGSMFGEKLRTFKFSPRELTWVPSNDSGAVS